MGVLKVWDPVSGTYVDVVGKGVAQSATDHGLLTGLSDPDHQIGSVQGLQAALDGKADDDHVHATSSSVRRFALENPATTTPTTGEVSIATTTGQGRTFRVSKTDADGVGYNLAPLLPGDGITVTDDPTTPPVTGFARYTVTSDVTDAGTFWQFDATRTDTSGTTTPPANGTIVRFIPTMSGGGTTGSPMSLDDLTDVDTTGSADGALLGYTGTGWVDYTGEQTNAALSGASAVNMVAAAGAAQTLPATREFHDVTMDQDLELTFDAPPSNGHAFVLVLRGAFTPTFPASVDWSGGSAPTYTTPAAYVFVTVDKGTVWLGSQMGKAFA